MNVLSRLIRNAVALAVIGCIATTLLVGSAHGQYHQRYAGQQYNWPCLPATPVPPHCPTEPTKPDDKKDPSPAPLPQPEPIDPGFDPGSSVAGLGNVSAVPNMYGNLLRANRSVSFAVARTSGNGFLFDSGFTNVINSKVSENNSPIPRDRIGFRYNFFQNAQSVRGLDPNPPRFDQRFLAFIESPATRSIDVESYTFDLEKTFFDGLVSLQLRLPISRALASNLALNYGRLNGGTSRATTLSADGSPGTPLFVHPDFQFQPLIDRGNGLFENIETGEVGVPTKVVQPLEVLNVGRTPEETFGQKNTEFGDMNLILKGMMYQTQTVVLSAGLSLHIPTGQDTNVSVVDYAGNDRLNNAEIQRRREIHIANETWALSPFFAMLWAPNDRFFTQGFLQFELPLNGSNVVYRESLPALRPGLTPEIIADSVFLPPGSKFPPFTETGRINAQSLVHIDIGGGYWLYRNPAARLFTGLAAMAELHYTGTMENADVIRFSGDFERDLRGPDGTFNPLAATDLGTPGAPGPRVGNLRNHMHIVDVTVGGTVLVAEQATVGTAFTFPLNNENNRTHDWEFQIQLNILYGGRFSPAVPPSF